MEGRGHHRLPLIVASALTLIKPLTGRYWRFIVISIVVIGLSFVGGMAFAYYVMLPAGMSFLLSFGRDIAVPLIDISEYLALFTSLVFWTGVIFTMPPVMFGLTKVGVVEYRTLRSPTTRKLVVGFALIFAAILTPTTDLVTYGFMFVPMVSLYEVGVFAAWVARPETGNYLWLKTARDCLARIPVRVYYVGPSIPRAYRNLRGMTRKQVVIAGVVVVVMAAAAAGVAAWVYWDEVARLVQFE